MSGTFNITSGNVMEQFSTANSVRSTSQAQQLAQSGDHDKIEHAAKQFESILLASWLEQAEKSFATVPGGEDDENADPGKNNFQGFAMQAVAMSITNAGGIGIAPMIVRGLEKLSTDAASSASDSGQPAAIQPDSSGENSK